MGSRNLSRAKWTALTLTLLASTSSTANAHAKVNSPNGGEVLTAGSVINIEWEVTIEHPLLGWDLWYSTNGVDGPFIPIAMSIPAGSPLVGDVHSLAWTVPDDPSNEVRIRLFMDNTDTDWIDFSDDDLTIVSAPDPFPSHCSGDGGDQMGCTDCPCMNNAPVGTVGGCLNSASTSGRLEASGDASVSLPSGSTTDLRMSLTGAPPSVFCILTSGDGLAPNNPANPCFGLGSGSPALVFDGIRCAVTSTRRHGGRASDANGEVGVADNPWGGEGNPAAGLAQAGLGFTAGRTRYFQVVHRDDITLGCMRGLNTSQAVEVQFVP